LPEVFDALFELYRKWKGYTIATLVEANAMQRGIVDLLTEEQYERNSWLNLVEINAVGDKVVRIRSTFSVALSQGSIYATQSAASELIAEQMAFPSQALDVLDESEKAISYLKAPASDEAIEEQEVRRNMRKYVKIGNSAGY
jgi:phage terminase large subunit-like protein